MQSPPLTSAFYDLATLLAVINALGLVRAWQLLGGRQYLLTDWLNPLQDFKEGQTRAHTDQSAATNKTRQDEPH